MGLAGARLATGLARVERAHFFDSEDGVELARARLAHAQTYLKWPVSLARLLRRPTNQVKAFKFF